MTYLVLYISSGPYHKQLFVKCSSNFEVYNIHTLLFPDACVGGGLFSEKRRLFQNRKTGPPAGPISIIYLAKFLFHSGKSIFFQPAYLSLRYADLSGNLHLGFSFKKSYIQNMSLSRTELIHRFRKRYIFYPFGICLLYTSDAADD